MELTDSDCSAQPPLVAVCSSSKTCPRPQSACRRKAQSKKTSRRRVRSEHANALFQNQIHCFRAVANDFFPRFVFRPPNAERLECATVYLFLMHAPHAAGAVLPRNSSCHLSNSCSCSRKLACPAKVSDSTDAHSHSRTLTSSRSSCSACNSASFSPYNRNASAPTKNGNKQAHQHLQCHGVSLSQIRQHAFQLIHPQQPLLGLAGLTRIPNQLLFDALR
jgi:hypothetical protein